MLLKYHLDRFGRVNTINTTPHYFAQIIANIFLCTDEGELAEYEAFLYGRQIISTMPVDVNKKSHFSLINSLHFSRGKLFIDISDQLPIDHTPDAAEVRMKLILHIRNMLLYFVTMIEERHNLNSTVEKEQFYHSLYQKTEMAFMPDLINVINKTYARKQSSLSIHTERFDEVVEHLLFIALWKKIIRPNA